MTPNGGMSAQPRVERGRLAIRQQVDYLVPFEVADHRAVTLAALPGPVINSNYGWCAVAMTCPPADEAQQGVVADRQHQTPGKTGSGAATKGQS